MTSESLEMNNQRGGMHYVKKAFSKKACTLFLIGFVTFIVCSIHMNGRVQAEGNNSNEAESLIKQAKERIFQAESAEREGRREEALELYEDAISFYEEARRLDESIFDHLDYSQLAGCYIKLDNYPQAIDALDNGIKKMGESGQTHEEYLLYIYLANIYRDMGELDRAIEIYKSQVDVGEEDPDWYEGLAGLYEQVGDKESARAVYNNAFNMLVFDETLYLKCSSFLINNGYLHDAEAVTYKAIVAFQEEPYILPQAYENLLTVYERQGRRSETLGWVRQKLDEAKMKAEEYWNRPSPEEERFKGSLIWMIVIVSLIFLGIALIVAILTRRHQRSL